ncbi:glutathione-disulfide reductase [Cocleimonas sp. KMM 6892]|uniref:glutathione-disulfide reductase n=1 Tax=unclassified Cocleimonas TaxID=2639732 RepID=UPI002DC61F04|nr:glutathione-disulfide reductase [Cocleimonas sp. KMM 6892]MEC4714097.1 glutathione-disulfide reductase [Cocleimonas sp. KMM 6895]MEC4743428.1 glutathione-disulfide reductase [Cocleimonas sp. KMM 6896]
MMSNHYDLISIGAGSGGLSIAERAASYGAKVAVIENKELGGTCVNVGCVPKKVMWYAAGVAQGLMDAQDYGFDVDLEGGAGKLNWKKLVDKRENYIGGILDWYDGYLGGAGVEVIEGGAKFLDNKTIEVDVDGEKITYTADNIVIATGGRPIIPANIEGSELGLNSDGFFQELHDIQPKKVVVVGGGYIALELAMLMDGLGSDVSVLHQGWPVLEGFDSTIQAALSQQMKDDGLKRYHDEIISKVVDQGEGPDGLKQVTIEFEDGTKITDVDSLIWAIGRRPNTDNIGLENTDVEVSPRGTVVVDDYEKTTVDGIYAIGDIIGKAPLTPVAIAAGRRLGDRLYGGKPERKMSYDDIATVMFTHPPIGTIGMSEEKALEVYGDDVANGGIKVYKTDFVPMYHTMTRHKVKTHMKLIVQGENEKIVGCHIIGLGADEMLQGFAVAIRMGATKADFDDTIAIHPVSAEELVTMK